MHKFSMRRLVLAAVASLLLVSTVFHFIFPAELEVTTTRHGVTQEKVQLPWRFSEPSLNNIVATTINVDRFTPRTWHVTPDDFMRSIIVNGVNVDLSHIGPGLHDYGNGFNIDLSDYLVDGQPNHLVFAFDNGGGDGGLDVKPVLSKLSWLLVALSFLPFALSLCKAFRLLPEQTILLVLGTGVACAYWSYTPWLSHTYDVQGGSGHYDYIMYVATKLGLPAPLDGWTFYHPPVYYVVGAFFWRWADFLTLPRPEMIQVYCLFLWLIFLASSAGVIKVVLKNNYKAIYAATFALCLWPNGIMHSVCIGNDLALYACAGLVMWFTAQWWEHNRRKDFYWMAILCGFAMLCKSNGLPLIATCGSLVVLKLFLQSHETIKRRLMDVIIFSSITAFGLALSFAVRVYFYVKGITSNWLISNAGNLHSGLAVPRDLKAFLPLDIPTFLTNPWMSAWGDETGRYNFWNYLLRSSLTGEFNYTGKFRECIAYFWGAVLLALCFLGIRWIINQRSQFTVKASAPWVFFFFFWIASLIVLRIQLPFSCSNDFRYIIPVLVPVIICWSLSGKMARTLLTLFSLSSIIFFTIA